MKLPSFPFVVLDTETTGFVPKVHRVIEFASVRCEDGEVTHTYEQLFATAELPSITTAITRIRAEDLAGKPAFAEKREEILRAIGTDTIIVGQNTSFDLGMLKGEGLDLTDRTWIDTSMLASLVFPELESYSLGYLSTALKLDHEPKHRALGDVRATLALLGACWERLLELPAELEDATRSIAGRAPRGYRELFDALPRARRKKRPTWLALPPKRPVAQPSGTPEPLPTPAPGTVHLVGDSLDPTTLESLLFQCLADPACQHWIAVKNLETTLARTALPKGVRILHPPSWLPDPEAAKRFAEQESFTADEATLAWKLAWYEPSTRSELPLHGNEDDVWHGKLACTERSPAYTKQFQELPRVILVDHRQLLTFLADTEHAAHPSILRQSSGQAPLRAGGALRSDAHIVITDASMLEDTATKAYGEYCNVEEIRAAASGNALLTKIVDVLQLWIEKTRAFQDLRYLARADLLTPEAKGLRDLLADLQKTPLPEQATRRLAALVRILDPAHLENRITWIEQRQNGDQVLSSVPERIDAFLAEHLYKRFGVTLLVPPGEITIPEVLPVGVQTEKRATSNEQRATIPLQFPIDTSLEMLMQNPPDGRTILLLNSRGAIEDLFVKNVMRMEDLGVTLLCQGTSGGQGRLQAEFTAAKRAILVMTPWMFEGILLPHGTADRLIITGLPFDHPSHAVLSKRSAHYRSSFSEYALPRLLCRMFRLLRTWSGMRTDDGEVLILDERLRTKEYGKTVRSYLEQFVEGKKGAEGNTVSEEIQAKAETNFPTKSQRKTPAKTGKDQMKLF